MVALMRRDLRPRAQGVAVIIAVAGLAAGPTAMAQSATVQAGGTVTTSSSSPGVEPGSASREGPACPLVQVTLWSDREGLIVRLVPHCIEIEHTATITKGDQP